VLAADSARQQLRPPAGDADHSEEVSVDLGGRPRSEYEAAMKYIGIDLFVLLVSSARLIFDP
jgi:hypothetical protein